MTHPTDKASVAAQSHVDTISVAEAFARSDELKRRASETRDRLMNEGHPPKYAHEVKSIPVICTHYSPPSPAQGDGMRDALVKLRYAHDHAKNRDREDAYLAAIAIVEAAIASHPDRQPGMTDEEAKSLWAEEYRRGGETAYADIVETTAIGDLPLRDQMSIAAIKRASQGDRT